MEHRTLGRTGVRLSPLTLGTMLFGDAVDEEAAERQIRAALDAGINSIDTADVYAKGASEEIVGRVLRRTGVRDRLVLASKFMVPTSDDPNDRGTSRRHVIAACHASLRRLGVDHLDVYYIHRPSTQIPIDETLRGLDHLVSTGCVRYLGTSSFAAWQLVESLWAAKEHHLDRPVVDQSPYSLVERRVERELLPMAATYGIGITVWSPLAGGLLTGKYRAGASPDGARLDRSSAGDWDVKHFGARADAVVEAVCDLAAAKGCTPAQLSLAWLLTRPVTSVVVGARTQDQLLDQLAAPDVVLDRDDLARLDAVSPPGRAVVPYYLDDAFADFRPHRHRW